MAVKQEPDGFTDEELALFEKLNIGTQGGLPLPSFIRPSEVVQQAQLLSTSIFSDWEELQRLVLAQEAQLLEKWKSLKRKKRRQALQDAWLAAGSDTGTGSMAMPLVHRPDLAAWRQHHPRETSSSQPSWTETDREAFLWPHINEEDLSGKAHLLCLLAHSRAQLAPHALASADLETTQLGKQCRALIPRYLNQYCMLFSERTTAATYGQLHAWDEVPRDEADRGTHPGEGLWILAIQARLYRFLRLAVCRILGPEGASGAQNTLQTTNGGPAVSPEYEDVPEKSLEAAYGPPSTDMDLQCLLDLAYAKVRQTEDHVWAMREDPEYFSTTLRDWYGHDSGAINSSEPSSSAWAHVVDACMRHALEQVEIWNIIYAKVHLLAQKLEKLKAAADNPRPGQPAQNLPKELSLAFYSLYHHIDNFEDEPADRLQSTASTSPPLRRYCKPRLTGEQQDKRQSAEQASLVSRIISGDNKAPPDVDEQALDSIIWAVSCLADRATRELLGRGVLLDELEMAIRRSKKEGEAPSCITALVAEGISTLSILAQCRAQLDKFQPLAGDYNRVLQQDTETRDILNTDFHMSMNRLRPLIEATIPEDVSAELVIQGCFGGEHAEQHKNESQTTACTKELLDAFWTRLETSLEDSKALTPHVRGILLDDNSRNSRRLSGRRALNGVVALGAATARTTRPNSVHFKADHRAARVFRALFHDPADALQARSSTPAAISWLDVVHALQTAGLSARRLHGSAWLFVPKTGVHTGKNGESGDSGPQGSQHPILFHEIWETAKLADSPTRRLGQRLRRVYGWDHTTTSRE